MTAKEPTATPGHLRITINDETTLEIPSDALRLYQDIEIRRKARQVVAPLIREGVESVTFSERADQEVVIEKGDLPAYEVPEGPDQPLLDQERELIVEITSVTFVEGQKWRLSEGQQTFYASLEDERFLERIQSGAEAFRKGDMLRCRMRIVQSRRGGGLHTEYHVVEVIEHMPRQTQLTFEGE